MNMFHRSGIFEAESVKNNVDPLKIQRCSQDIVHIECLDLADD